jgi:NAD(P)-dependent dehydrogenase (short-subunit alcohol dehydrogenase family)
LQVILCGGPVPGEELEAAVWPEIDETGENIGKYLYGSMALSLEVSISEARMAQFCAPSDAAPVGPEPTSAASGRTTASPNAAIQRWVPLLEMEDADWRDVIDNNLNGTANTVRAFAPKMVARKKGRFILISSMQGKHGTKDASSYSASKWGILGLMKSAAMEFGEHNITVNALIPGLVDTALTRCEKRLSETMAEQGQKVDHPTPQQAWDNRAPTVPLKVGWLQPDDISPVAVFLASDAANMVTGAEYEVTGGDSAKDI